MPYNALKGPYNALTRQKPLIKTFDITFECSLWSPKLCKKASKKTMGSQLDSQGIQEPWVPNWIPQKQKHLRKLIKH